jgi:hypothetical protein
VPSDSPDFAGYSPPAPDELAGLEGPARDTAVLYYSEVLGWQIQWIAANLGVTSQRAGQIRSRALENAGRSRRPFGGSRRRPEYGQYIPWPIKARHHHLYLARALLAYAKLRTWEQQGHADPPPAALEKTFRTARGFMEELDRLDALLACYDPDEDQAPFRFKHRLPGEDGCYVRFPDGRVA